ncbi:EAL domain-containing protein [Nocardiopsis sp. CT-R113]|uniref:EAL domain-containing protein n=1 Tax=Nocardiopsis codii TaxID=3065942 RepID=A0ABU7KH81_9ACTN|nr:EAL domain-containing protein [Nocardiopsis sp. CT-R113]MEE2041596.1 EAL domain-containing protein [Nocardiopsis sp. CT-R113]
MSALHPHHTSAAHPSGHGAVHRRSPGATGPSDPPGPSRAPGYRPIVDLDSGAVVAVEVVAAPPAPSPAVPGGPPTAEMGVPEGTAVADWVLGLVAEAAGTESLLPLVLPLPARILTAGEGFVALVESRIRRAGRRPRDITFLLGADLADLHRSVVLPGVSRLRAAGFRCGFGTSMVRPDLVVEAAPFLMRIDPGIVSGVATDQRHATVVEGLARIGRGSGVYAMASGVEAAEDVLRLRACGIRLGTGAFFADRAWRPGERVTPVPEPTAGQGREEDAGPRVTEFMLPPVGFDSDTTTEQVLEAFTGDPALNSVILIDHRERPVGVIDRTRFLLSMTGRYGHALHAKRPALRLAESPRTIPAWMTALAALRVAGQDTERVYDDLVATNSYGQCLGVVHISDLIQSLSRS